MSVCHRRTWLGLLICALCGIYLLSLSYRLPPVNDPRTVDNEILRENKRLYKTSSPLSEFLLAPEGSPPPPKTSVTETFRILVWQYGKFLEKRHLRHFTDKIFSPWENCSVSNCILSYNEEDLNSSDAVIFHVHRTKNVRELPERTRFDQRWIFLTDETPFNTFLYRKQSLSDYDGIFNWSMSYRMDSDVPVPYGRTVLRKYPLLSIENEIPPFTSKRLVAILGSNCGGRNNRWDYVKRLKAELGSRLQIYGHCLGGNTVACPGHFDKNCIALNDYKFYLSFENSNCREYLTEKVFWNAYHKYAVPVIMGAPKIDCDQLLPPSSYLHVDDFESPAALASRLIYLDDHDEEYRKFHSWRKKYKILNDHGYFGSDSQHYCRVCQALNYNPTKRKVYTNLKAFWNSETDCYTL